MVVFHSISQFQFYNLPPFANFTFTLYCLLATKLWLSPQQGAISFSCSELAWVNLLILHFGQLVITGQEPVRGLEDSSAVQSDSHLGRCTHNQSGGQSGFFLKKCFADERGFFTAAVYIKMSLLHDRTENSQISMTLCLLLLRTEFLLLLWLIPMTGRLLVSIIIIIILGSSWPHPPAHCRGWPGW